MRFSAGTVLILTLWLQACSPSPKKEHHHSQQLGHVVIQATDLDRSRQFYENHLYLRVTEEAVFKGKKRYFLSGTGSHHELVLNQSSRDTVVPVKQRYLQQVAFEVPGHKELVEYYEELQRSGLPLELKNNQLSLSVYFYDPDSVQIELYWDVRKEPFGKPLWQGNQVKLTEEQLRNPYEQLR